MCLCKICVTTSRRTFRYVRVCALLMRLWKFCCMMLCGSIFFMFMCIVILDLLVRLLRYCKCFILSCVFECSSTVRR